MSKAKIIGQKRIRGHGLSGLLPDFLSLPYENWIFKFKTKYFISDHIAWLQNNIFAFTVKST